MGVIEFRILGPVTAVADGVALPLRGRPLELLAVLLIERGTVVPPDRAIDALWGDAPPGDPRNALQVVVSRLRSAIGEEHVALRAGGYAIALESGALDAARFEDLLDRARVESKNDQPAAAADTLRAALALWHGAALADVATRAFAQAEAGRLEELRLEALEARIDADLALGGGADLVGELQALVAVHPLRERLRAALMLALARSGRQADALETYRTALSTFRDELGLDPGKELQELHRAILRQQAPAAPSARAPSRRALPLPVTPLVGRTAELATVTTLLLQAGRLLTLCGPGGTGKTRLALHVAHGLGEAFPDGVVAVDLAPLRDGSDVMSTVARALAGDDARPLGEPAGEIRSRAAGQRLLVVLDNAEHVVLDASAAVGVLLSVEGPRVLATSRAPLAIEQETCYDVPPLTPADGVAMFTACARRIDASFAPDEATSLLCARLDWLPLAIELAAARAAILAPAQLLERLRERLDLLDAGPGADPRHRTLRATTDWSVEMLDDEQAQLFRRLSVFAADAPWEDIEAVCQTSPETLDALVERRLVRRGATWDRRPRLGMLETLRQHAAELLAADPDELAICRRRHAEAMLARARAVDAERGSMLELEAMRPELLAALATARDDPDPEMEIALVSAMHALWRLRGPYVEGIDALERALVRARSTTYRAHALLALADLAALHGDPARGAALAREALDDAQEAGDQRAQARALNLVGNAAFSAADLESAVAAYRQAIELERPHGTSGYLLAPLANLGHTLLELGDLTGARSTLEECLVASAEADDRRRASACLHSLGLLALHEGRIADADEALRAGLEIASGLGIAKYQIDILGVLGATRVAQGAVTEGVRLLACSDVHGAELGLTPDPGDSVALQVRETAVRSAVEEVGPGAFELAYAEGRSFTLEAAVISHAGRSPEPG